MTKDDYARWVERYVSAWNTNDPDEISDLFGEDATYYTEPYEKPWRGRAAIVSGWLDHKDEPGDTAFQYEVLIAGDELGIVKGSTEYKTSGRVYDNLWEIRLGDDGRCREFVEWWMKRPGGDASADQ